MAIYHVSKVKLFLGSQKIKKGYLGITKIYSSGNIVTYMVDTGVSYQEEVDEGESCLSPKTFIPSKSGWTFVGWRGYTDANSEVFSSLAMGESPVTLYAVFRQTITVTYYNNSATASSTSKYRYYNNGNIANPSFALTQAASSGWTARGWSTSNAGNASITYANGASFTRDSNITLYGLYQQTITLSYNGNGNTGGSTSAQTGTRYWAPAGYVNPSFTLRANGFSKTNHTFSKWASGSTSGTQYAAGATVAFSANVTMYAVWTYVGSPFYIVKDLRPQQTVITNWTATKWDNGTGVEWDYFNAGDDGIPGVFTKGVKRAEEGNSFEAYSNAFSTKGNKTIRVTVCTNVGGYIIINGIRKDVKGGSSTLTFDISNISSISITVSASVFEYSGRAYFQFYEIYLY